MLKIIKGKVILPKLGSRKGYNTNQSLKTKLEHDIDIIVYLSFDEVMKLLKKDFDNDRLSQMSETSIVWVVLGLRFSDLSKHIANISRDHIVLSIQKQNPKPAIKLNKLKAILEKYKGTIYEPLPIISSKI